MNAKKKNKKANKPPNPNPPQKVESVPKTEEKVEELATKCEVKEEILPPKIPYEVTAIPVSDVKDSETPKKPKRNKGKNKKQDKDEKNEAQEKTQEVQIESFAKIEEAPQKIAIDEKDSEEKEDPLDEASVVPSARKKKNKKKTQEKPTQEATKAIDNNTIVLSEQTTEPVEKVDAEIQELFSAKPESPKLEGKKKKNKKKNRTDSERSDKSDNVLSCTSVFQNILAEDASELEQPDKSAETKELTCELEAVKTESMVTSAVETKAVEETKIDFKVEKEIPQNENKSKKKNKKDKKQQQKEIVEAPKQDLPEQISVPVEDVLTQINSPSEPLQQVKEYIQIPFESQKEKEPSPKPKAKIAKPVEKKQKGKLESESLENLLNVESSEIMSEDEKKNELFEEPKLKSEEAPTVNIIESPVEDQIKPQLSLTPSSIENINFPSDHSMGKKRKKSPKPHKNKEPHIKSDDEMKDTEKNKSEAVFDPKESTETILVLQPEIPVVTSDSVEVPLISPDAEVLPKEPIKVQNEPVIDLSQTISLERPITPEIKEDNEGFETKTNKKKKKTPKVPHAESASKMKEAIVQMSKIEDLKQVVEESKNISEEQNKTVSSESNLAPDIAVQSLETGTETLSCDVIPDVYVMRSSSQHQFDSNNNTVIQEVINVEDLKLIDPQLMPLIEGSGVTPARTPEPVSFGITMTEIEAKTPTEEKTDIKSKMMEVNQDMEELRLSIERSLAEFTALEKSENESEIKFDSLLKKGKSPVKDIKEESKIIEKTMPEVKKYVPEAVEIKESEKPTPALIEEECKLIETPPICPARKDNKGKNKSKKKGKQETSTTATTTTASDSSTSQSTLSKDNNAKEEKKDQSEKKSEQKPESSQEKGKQQSTVANDSDDTKTSKDASDEKQPINSELIPDTTDQISFEPIENFEDALTSSIDDVNITFEMIAKDADDDNIEFQKKLAANKPEINITTAEETDKNKNEKVNPVSQPKNLLGHHDIPVQSNRTDYKKEKNKTPNARQARVKIKDSIDIETKKQSKESQTDNKRSCKISDKPVKEWFSRMKNDNQEYVYKYSFRKVFLQSACHVCNRELSPNRVPCGYCNLIFYCGAKHKDDDWPQHQALCFAVSTLAHMKGI